MMEPPLAHVSPRTAFVLGNGPSLGKIDLAALSDYPTIGLNAAYRYWRTIDWRPTYYACLDEVVGLSHKDAIADLIAEDRIETFLLRGNLIATLGPIAQTRKVVNFDALRSRQPLLSPPTITTGSHAALWLAALGFDQIVLLGIDGQYKEVVDGAEHRDGIELQIVAPQSNNPNYFFDGYQQAGDRYNIPNPRPGLHVEAWHAAADQLSRASVDVYNANARSEVAVFPYIDTSDFLGDGSQVSPPREAIRLRGPSATLSQKPQPAEGTSAKLSRFAKGHSRGLVLIAGLCGLELLVGGQLTGWQPGSMLMLILGSGLVFGLAGLLLYTRFVVSEHLAKLQAMQDSLAQRLADIERLDMDN